MFGDGEGEGEGEERYEGVIPPNNGAEDGGCCRAERARAIGTAKPATPVVSPPTAEACGDDEADGSGGGNNGAISG